MGLTGKLLKSTAISGVVLTAYYMQPKARRIQIKDKISEATSITKKAIYEHGEPAANYVGKKGCELLKSSKDLLDKNNINSEFMQGPIDSCEARNKESKSSSWPKWRK